MWISKERLIEMRKETLGQNIFACMRKVINLDCICPYKIILVYMISRIFNNYKTCPTGTREIQFSQFIVEKLFFTIWREISNLNEDRFDETTIFWRTFKIPDATTGSIVQSQWLIILNAYPIARL